jgi:glycosyltransferase involved in cell wall biosynthesis
MVTVSVLIPVYNGAEFVSTAISSALNQRNIEVEVIVIDDGSTDATPAVLASFGDRIRVLRQSNAGHVKARNNGAKIAQGDWLAFLDADDDWLPDKLAKQLARVEGSIGMVYTERMNFGETDRVTGNQSDTQELLDGDIFEQLLVQGNFVTVSSVIIRKSIYEQLGGFEESLLVCEDWDMWLRYTAQGGLVGVVREPLTRYRWHPGAMTRNLQRMLEGRLKVVERTLALPRGQQVSRAVARRAVARCWEISAWYAAPVQTRLALAWYLRSAWHWPWNMLVYKTILKCCVGRN